MKQALLIATGLTAALSLTACGEQLERGETYPVDKPTAELPAQPAAPSDVVQAESAPAATALSARTADIDWIAAREDLASLPVDEDQASSFQVASGPDAPPVPVLLPQLDTAATASTDPADQPRFQPLSDGYFAAYPGDAYDIIVNGTNQIVGSTVSDAGSKDPAYLTTSAGAQVAFSKYGADYLIEFECNEISGDDGTCISEEDAIAIAQKVIIAGSR